MDKARDLKSLHHRIVRCARCPLHESRRHAVPGEGDAHAALMLVGEAPGEQEDLQGRPFCGRAGRFLDRLLAEVGLERPGIFITSTVKCRPPDNRNPRKPESDTCRDLWLERQVDLIDPKVVGIMGKVAAEAILGERGNLRDLHGRRFERDGRVYLVTYHPAAAMRFPEAAGHIEADFRVLANMTG